jgi:hypothetical protein
MQQVLCTLLIILFKLNKNGRTRKRKQQITKCIVFYNNKHEQQNTKNQKHHTELTFTR